MLTHHLRAAVVLAFACCSFAAELRPLGDLAGFIEPDTPAVVRWELEKGELPPKVDYVIRDYVEREVTRGTIDFTSGKPLELSVKLPQGYYDIELTGASQRYGLVALPQPAKEPNPFFCIDAAMSWLVRDEALRAALVKKLARCGIRTARERVTWGAINPAEGRYDWETPARYESLRKLYAANGIKVLEMFHDAPAWTGRVGKYPDDLVATAKAWNDIRGRWGEKARDFGRTGAWDALEIWNEPDIFFGGDLPADQYVALAKTLTWVMYEESWGVLSCQLPEIPRRSFFPFGPVAGAFAHENRAFLENAAENGLLECVDTITFHTYDRAEIMERIVGEYRAWLKRHDRPGTYLWLTECGRPWKKGPSRPPYNEDATSALDITMKAVEAFATGVEKYFAFVYPYYEENENNFGMMDRRGMPLRSMAAYVRAADILRGSWYQGDLKLTDPNVKRARLFHAKKRDLAVLYTGRPHTAIPVQLDFRAERVESIDGRPLQQAVDGTITIPDGLAWVWLTPEDAKPRRQFTTTAMKMRFDFDEADDFARDRPHPVVLRFDWDKEALRPCSAGYRVVMDRANAVQLTARAFNLSDEPLDVTVALDADPALIRPTTSPRSWRSTVDKHGVKTFSCTVDLTNAFVESDTATVKFNLEDPSRKRYDPKPLPLVVRLLGEPTFEQLLKRYPNRVKLPVDELSRWQRGAPGHAKDEMAKGDGGWRLKVGFGPGDRWCYPRFTLPEDVDLSKATALVVRARCQKRAMVRLFLWESESVGYITNGSIIPADGQWHTATVRFSDLTLSGANAPDPNGKLDLDKVRRISFGFNSDAADNELEVSDACVVADPATFKLKK